MRELKRNIGPTNLSIRLWTLKDKKSMFRASYPDQHIVEVSARSEGDDTRHGHNVIILERSYEDYAKAKEYYQSFLGAFGHRLQIVKRKEEA